MLVEELRAIADGEPSTLNAGEADRFAADLEALFADVERLAANQRTGRIIHGDAE
jgi:hypothetical protein